MNGFVPMRRCVGCMRSYPKDQLIRLDFEQTGRGCYLCRNEKCIEAAIKKNGFARSLKRRISAPEMQHIYELLDISDQNPGGAN